MRSQNFACDGDLQDSESFCYMIKNFKNHATGGEGFVQSRGRDQMILPSIVLFFTFVFVY